MTNEDEGMDEREQCHVARDVTGNPELPVSISKRANSNVSCTSSTLIQTFASKHKNNNKITPSLMLPTPTTSPSLYPQTDATAAPHRRK